VEAEDAPVAPFDLVLQMRYGTVGFGFGLGAAQFVLEFGCTEGHDPAKGVIVGFRSNFGSFGAIGALAAALEECVLAIDFETFQKRTQGDQHRRSILRFLVCDNGLAPDGKPNEDVACYDFG